MQKIMFNDHYGLTQAVLEGRKTMTRRDIKCPRKAKGVKVFGYNVCTNKDGVVTEIATCDADERTIDGGTIMPAYKVGEIVAVAQKYSSFIKSSDWDATDKLAHTKGWNNKMFVAADQMPHQIRITAVRAERLQDISDEGCMKEGVIKIDRAIPSMSRYGIQLERNLFGEYGNTPREAFAALIDKVSGKGTWNRNPWVWVYEFELVK